jgi:hypothetical protein
MSLSTFSNLLYKISKKSLGKFFQLFDFGHFFCPFLNTQNTFVKLRDFVTIFEFYGLVAEKIIQKLLLLFFRLFSLGFLF